MDIRQKAVTFATAFLLLGADPSGGGEIAGPVPSPGAIYDPDPSHLWNRVHGAFFSRADTDADLLDPDSVDPPLWPDTSEFLKTGASYRAAVDVLDEFLENGDHLLNAGPLHRAVLQHDLWAVFDWSSDSKPAERGEDLAELRSRLARAIKLLALSREEIASLPDNLANTALAKNFSEVYDSENHRRPFLPGDLLAPEGPWVCVRGAVGGPGAPVHVTYYRGRSPFLVFIQLPGGRDKTLDYLRNLNRETSRITKHDADDLPQFPVGTKTALLRRMTVIGREGQIQVTPLVQTLQMRVYRQVGSKATDHDQIQAAFKFRMKRSLLFSEDHCGLVAVQWDEPLRNSLLRPSDIYERDFGATSIKNTMQSCIACHSCGGGGTIHSIFTYKQDDWVPGANLMAPNRLRLIPTKPSTEMEKTISWKEERYEWGLLKGLLAAQP